MNSKRIKTVSLTISKDNIISQVAAFLYATGSIPENCEVLDIIFFEREGDQVPIEVIIKKDLEVRAFRATLNGQKEKRLQERV